MLLEGETGTGKQVLARAIHNLDRKRRAFPIVTVHCSTITEPLAGNVRELENAIQRMLFAKSEGTKLGLVDWLAQCGEEESESNRDLVGEGGAKFVGSDSRARPVLRASAPGGHGQILPATCGQPGSMPTAFWILAADWPLLPGCKTRTGKNACATGATAGSRR